MTGGFAIAILALLCVPFVFFGINYDFTGSSYAAKVEGLKIPAARFESEYQAELARFAEFGGELQPELRRLIRRSVLDNLIRETLVEAHLAESGYRISDKMITDYIQEVPEFQVDGRFSKDRYYSWLDERGLTPTMFEENQRRGLRLAQFQRGLAATAFVTPADYRRYLNLTGEQRRTAIATFDVDAVAENVEIPEEEIRGYYDANKGEFQSPESVDLQYVLIDREALSGEVEVDEDELRQYYEESANRYLQDERRTARHILIEFGEDKGAAREKAAELLGRIEEGESFEQLAREHSADSGTAARGGDLGSMMRTQLPDALGAAIFSMQRGDVEGPVESDFGFHIIRLDEIQQGGPLPYEEVRAELEREYRDTKADETYRRLEREMSDALFDAQGIDDMAAGTGLDLGTASGFTRSGGEPFGNNQNVIDAVFSPDVLEGGALSNIVELDANRTAVFKVTEYREAAPQPFEEVRETIAERLRSEEALEIVRERAAAMQAALEAGEDFTETATQYGAEASAYAPLRRQSDEVDPRVLDAVFRAPKPSEGKPAVGNAVTEEGDYAVFSVVAVEPGRPEAVPLPERDAGKLQLASSAGAADYTAFVLELERNAEIERGEDVLAEPEF